MYKVKELIVTEGMYDKIKLSQYIDGAVFVTNGFTVFTNKDMQKTIRRLGEKNGIVILTDSDSAGFKIRNFVKQLLPPEKVKHAYIPDVAGKERRKRAGGKEGLLGVEGIDGETIINALKQAGCAEGEAKRGARRITKADMYRFGLSGGENSRSNRAAVTNALGLPYKISANMLLDVLNMLFDYDEFCDFMREWE
ncbi:MAG: DUF4093 domain-containing protein [Firmicutes bacterium]|nr:DUF4093 domain-containing protein [Bacillota bacterium]